MTTPNMQFPQVLGTDTAGREAVNLLADAVDAAFKPTINPAEASPSNTGLISQLLGWIAGRIEAITGGANWYDSPAYTLAKIKTILDGTDATKIPAAALAADVYQSGQFVNEFKGWPPYVPLGDSVDRKDSNLWWPKLGTPTSIMYWNNGAAGGYPYADYMRVITNAGGQGVYQRWAFADEPRLNAGRTFSALIYVASVAGGTLTLSLINSDGSKVEVAKGAGTSGLVALEGLTLAGTYVDFEASVDGEGSFNIVPLGARIGHRAMALPPRPTHRIRREPATWDLGPVDLGGAWYSWDARAATSPLTISFTAAISYMNNTAARGVRVPRLPGSAITTLPFMLGAAGAEEVSSYGSIFVNDLQRSEWASTASAGDSESLYAGIVEYEEWA